MTESRDLLQAFGNASLRLLQQNDRISDLEGEIAVHKQTIHHQAIQIQALTDTNTHLLARIQEMKEKAETVLMPAQKAEPPLLKVEEYDLEEEMRPIKPQIIEPFSGGNPPLYL